MRIILLSLLLACTFSAPAQNANVATDFEFKEPPANSTIRARVYYEDTGRAVKRTSVMFITKDRGGGEVAGTTDADGNIEVKNVRAGKYYAIVNAPGVVSPMAYIDLRRDRADSFDEQLAGFTPIVVNGISDLQIQIPARRGGAISGRVTYADGDTAIGVKVEILRKVDNEYLASLPNFSVITSLMGGGAGTFQTDDRGYFRFAGLPAGEYIVKVSESVVHNTSDRKGYGEAFESMFFGPSSMVTYFFENALDKNDAQVLTVAFGQEHPEINMVLPARGLHALVGKVVAAKGKLPVKNARLYLKREGDDVGGQLGPERRQYSLSDEKGAWRFNELPKGKYKVIVEAENSELDEEKQVYGINGSNTPANTASNVMGPSRVPKPPVKKFAKKIQEITIEDKDIADIVVELSFGSTVSGTLTTEDNKDLPNNTTIKLANESDEITSVAQVYNYNYDPESETAVRKTTRDFQIEGVTAGKTYLTVQLGDAEYYVKSAFAGTTDLLKESFEITEGEQLKNVKIVLAKDTGIVKGTIIDGDKQPVAGAQVSLVPADPAKARNSSFYRTTRSDENGEFEIKLAPMEYAVVSIPAGAETRRDDFYKWLGTALKSAQTFKVEAGKTNKVTIKREAAKAAP